MQIPSCNVRNAKSLTIRPILGEHPETRETKRRRKKQNKRKKRKALGKSNRNLFRNLSKWDRRKCSTLCASGHNFALFRFSRRVFLLIVSYFIRFGFGPGTSIIRERKVSGSGRFYSLLLLLRFFCSLFIFFYSSSPAEVVFVSLRRGSACVCVVQWKSNGYKPKESKCHRIYCC